MPSMAQGEAKSSVQSSSQTASRYRMRQTITEHRKSLPIASVEKRLIEEVQKNDILLCF